MYVFMMLASRLWLVCGAAFAAMAHGNGKLDLPMALVLTIVFVLPFVILHWPTEGRREAKERWRRPGPG